MTLKVSLIGLSKIGTSLGLAFSKHPSKLTCVGYDSNPEDVKGAVKRGAITKSFLALHRSVQDSNVIILTCPLEEVREALIVIAEHAPKGTVVIDTSSNKSAVAGWAKKILPEGKYFSGWTMALNPEHLYGPELGIDAARGDLFENSFIAANIPPDTPEDVVTLSTNLVTLLGAKPYFIDQAEADGLIAMGHELPRVAALATILATVDSPGWPEARKLAGPDYAKGTLPVLSFAGQKNPSQSLIHNRENIIRLVDDLVQALMRVRGYLEEADEDALNKALEHAIHQRNQWLDQRRQMSWEPSNQVDLEELKRPSIFRGLLGSRFKKGDDT